ncbi:glycogen debranching protein [Geminocystis sp. GBBB08]|uniref:glycogen debranching protein n=1 Tax=Geminocystis sp. GBBB08 TaxID=2604140 RepID=UPI0027E2C603|nr:glycogen debranching protein [Geminocystis sp. GBBB08]MBL1210651.1 glycogen debranching protein [Geminocystis sp. GBBB08]
MTIWVNEQKDGCGIIQACIATTNQQQAEDCHANWEKELTPQQKEQGWEVTIKTVASWDDVPVNALKLN